MDDRDFKFELAPLGQIVWEDRYALKDENGNRIENSILENFRRVAKAIASKEKDPEKWEKKFYEIMADKYFCPAGRILAHAGTNFQQLLNCFVLPFEDDSLESIMATAKNMAIVQKYSGGTGFNYSTLRPAGSYIKGVNGRSCGVPGFINMMSTVSEVIEQGGSRRGANMGLLDISHPDVWEFISYKNDHNWDKMREFIEVKDEERWSYFKYENLYKLQMYNVSIGVNDEFFEALRNDQNWPLMWKGVEWQLYTVKFTKANGKEKTFEVTADSEKTAMWKVKKLTPFPSAKDKFEVINIRKIKASEIWNRICYNAWADGCPGLLNMTTIREFHNIEYASPAEGSNPCAEQILGKYGACLLSSLPLSSFVKEGKMDYPTLKDTIHTAIRFMDDVIDNCEYPLPQIKGTVNKERRIGLGVMGVHDVLIAMEKSYDTDEGRDAIAKVLEFIRDEAYRASIDIAKEKGPFPLYDQEKYLSSKFIKTLPLDIQENIKKNKIRNSCILSIAPTGTIGTMYNSSTGCEPWFSLSMQRNTRLGSYEDGCPAYLKWRNEHPDEKIPEYFKTSQDIAPEDHVKMLLLFSKYIDSSVSKCIAEGTLIVTNRGIIPIEAFSSGKHVPDTFYTPNNDYKVIDENGMPQKVISHYCGGQKHCYTLRFENGFEMTVADTHLLKIPCGWISVKDIQKGDKIFYRTNGIGNECNYVPLEQPKFTGLTNEKKYNFPKILNEKYALFLGMWLADGCASKNSIIVCEKNDTVKAVVEELFPLLFGAKAKIQTDKRHGVRSHVLNSRVLVKYFKEKYGTDCVTKKIPEEIMRSPESVHRAFLSGLSLDGYKNRNMLVIYEGYSQQIAKSVASILSMYGIKYYLGNRAVKTGRKAKRTYSIMASLINRDFISPVEPHKKNYALATSTSWPVYISPEIAVKYRTLPKCRISPNHVNPEYISLRNFRSSLSKRCFINQGIVEKVCPRADLNLRCLTVRDKIDAGMKLVYDIGVANTHSYLINGIVSHNTVNLPNSATVEDISKIFLMATKGGAKGITVFRDGSKEGVLISKDSKKEIITEAQKIVEDLQGVKSSEDENDTRVAPKKRGNRVVGATTRIHMQKHNLYVTVNRNKEGDIIETFATVGESKEPDAHHTSGVEDSWAEALGKMISLALRAGVKPDSIVRNLKNIPSDKPVFHTIGDCETSEPIPSPPHAIARVIEEELKYSCPVQYKAEAGPKKGGPCPECGSTNTTQKATCIVCNDCGYSGCG